jgi:hypothetical protein
MNLFGGMGSDDPGGPWPVKVWLWFLLFGSLLMLPTLTHAQSQGFSYGDAGVTSMRVLTVSPGVKKIEAQLSIASAWKTLPEDYPLQFRARYIHKRAGVTLNTWESSNWHTHKLVLWNPSCNNFTCDTAGEPCQMVIDGVVRDGVVYNGETNTCPEDLMKCYCGTYYFWDADGPTIVQGQLARGDQIVATIVRGPEFEEWTTSNNTFTFVVP